MQLCLADLAQLVQGTIHLGSMPPLAGRWTAVDRIVLDSHLVQPGDLFWHVPGLRGQTAGSVQHALLRGAVGVVAQGKHLANWPGAFWLEVNDSLAALARLADRLDELDGAGTRPAKMRFADNLSELKDLQLCGLQAPDITPPTCGRPTAERFHSRCVRRAA